MSGHLALMILSAAAAAAVGAAHPLTSMAPEAGTRRMLEIAPLKGDQLDPTMSKLVPGLLSAALESGGAHQVLGGAPSDAGWQIEISVSGRGPWKLSARATPQAPETEAPRITSGRFTFADREELTVAVDALAADLDASWRELGLTGTGDGKPVPLRQALSASTTAVDAYLEAMAALSAGDPSGAVTLLDQALAADPSFDLAAVERACFDIARGDLAAARSTLVGAAGGQVGSPQVQEQTSGMTELLKGDVGRALEIADAAIRRGPHQLWPLRLRGLGLAMSGRSIEALWEWSRLTSAAPKDPRYRMWLATSHMAHGDQQGAARAYGEARSLWPGLLMAYTMQAEVQVRQRDTAGARQTLLDMKRFMSSGGIEPTSDALNPDLMLGSVDLAEGRVAMALKQFESANDTVEKSSTQATPIGTIRLCIAELRRDLIGSRDPLAKARQVEDALEAVDRYEETFAEEDRRLRPWIFLRLRGLIKVREGLTVDAWRIIEQIRSHSGDAGYSEYYDAYLTAVTMLKEGDDLGSTAQFERAAGARGTIVELLDAAQMQASLQRHDEAMRNYKIIERRLERYDPWMRATDPQNNELVIATPHSAALLPVYHYARAQWAYETGDAEESRSHFNKLLKYLQNPDDQFLPYVKEAYGRGAKPE